MNMVGKGYIVGMESGSVSIPSLPAYFSPNLQGGSVSHNTEIDRVPNERGQIEGVIPTQEFLEISFNVVPRGASTTQAKASAGLPLPCQGITITGLPVMRIGSFADALNGTNWVYEGGGEVTMSSTEKWSMTLPLRRYPAITSTTGIPMYTPPGGT